MRRTSSLLTLVLAGSVVAPLAVESVAKAEPMTLDQIVAVVNDDIVLQSEVEEAMRYDPRVREAQQMLGPNPSPQQLEAKLTETRNLVLDDLVNRKLVLEEAKKFQITVSDRDLDMYLANLASQNQMKSVDELRAAVEETGEFGSWAEYKAKTREDILWFQTQQILATWNVTDAQVREYYRKMSRGEDARVEVARFVFRPKGDDPKARDAAYAAAKKAVRRLNSGEPIERIAGDLGQEEVTREIARGEIAPDLEDAIFAARAGEVVGPLHSAQGHIVFKVIEHHASDVVPFEQAKERIREQLEMEAQTKAMEELNEQLRAKAHIEIRI
jgi:peptidyl-prolyl cis-trans isomerase SurA